jgi:hypothetical protein
MNKIGTYFEGKLLTGSFRKWGAMENISTSEEVMVLGENCVIWTCKDLYSSENVAAMVMQKDEMGASCDKHGGEEKCVQGSGGKTCRKESA